MNVLWWVTNLVVQWFVNRVSKLCDRHELNFNRSLYHLRVFSGKFNFPLSSLHSSFLSSITEQSQMHSAYRVNDLNSQETVVWSKLLGSFLRVSWSSELMLVSSYFSVQYSHPEKLVADEEQSWLTNIQEYKKVHSSGTLIITLREKFFFLV